MVTAVVFTILAFYLMFLLGRNIQLRKLLICVTKKLDFYRDRSDCRGRTINNLLNERDKVKKILCEKDKK